MANGWAEFLEQLANRAKERQGQEVGPSAWAEFLQRVEASTHAPLLREFARVVQNAPVEDRVLASVVLASVLAPLEWPPEWELHRPALVESIVLMVKALDPQGPDSLFAQLEQGGFLVPSEMMVLASAVTLLRTPCRRDELPTVARMCTVGVHSCMTACRRALASRQGQPLARPLMDALPRLIAAHARYAQAARALNAAMGEALLGALDEKLEVPET